MDRREGRRPRNPTGEPVIESLDALKDAASRRNRVPSGLHDQAIEAGEIGERAANSLLANQVDLERQMSQGKTDAQVEAEADQWLREHGSADLIDPTLK